MNLKAEWQKLTAKYTDNGAFIELLWSEIYSAYTSDDRHYHSLEHVEFMAKLALEHKLDIWDFETVQFSIFYHDLVYKAHKKDNEERSAEIAKKRLEALGVGHKRIQKCYDQILATKSHDGGRDTDTKILLDIDLAILGQDREAYKNYAVNVRKEYIIYPDELYYPGRIKVLQHFLDMKSIYKTEKFISLFEQNAKANLEYELQSISH